MKTRLLIIIGIAIIGLLLPLQLVYAPPAQDHESAFDYAEHVIIGKILSVEILSIPNTDPSVSNGFALYEIKVEEYLKNPLDTDIIKVPGSYVNKESPRGITNLLYEVDQKVFLYIQKDYPDALVDYDLIILDRLSRVLDEPICGLNATYQKGKCIIGKSEIFVDPSLCWGHVCIYDFVPPLKQSKSGISIDEIQCRESLTLVTKHDSTPACVKPETKTKLIERGWVQHDKESDKIIINYMSDVIQSNKNGIVTNNDKWTFIEKTITENNLESFTEMYFQDLKKEYQNDEKITFNLKLFGYSHPICIFPSLSLYVDEYPQDPIYTGHVAPHTCPFGLENKPVFKSWDENDFRFFPICKYQGKYTIVGHVYEFNRVIGSFTCNGEKEFKPPKTVKIIIPQGASDPLFEKNFDPSQITLNWGDYITFVNQDDASYRITTSYHDPNVGKSHFTLNGGESSNPMKIRYDGIHWLSSKTYPYDNTSIVPWMNATIYMN